MIIEVDIPREEYEYCKKNKIKDVVAHHNISYQKASFYRFLSKHSEVKPTHSLQRKGSVVGAFACIHTPFDHNKYLKFLVETFEARGVSEIVCLGDIIDNHALTFHEVSEHAYSAGHELEEARKRLKPYWEAFPDVKVCLGNHDRLPYRKAKTVGIPSKCLKDPQDLWDTPDGWVYDTEHWIDNVRYVHGDSMGKAFNLACADGYSVVMGHLHTLLSVQYRASKKMRVFGCQVGCGIDATSYAMEYGKPFKHKPILGCAVVRGGIECEVVPMPLELTKYKRNF